MNRPDGRVTRADSLVKLLRRAGYKASLKTDDLGRIYVDVRLKQEQRLPDIAVTGVSIIIAAEREEP